MKQGVLNPWPQPDTHMAAFEIGENEQCVSQLMQRESMWIHGPSGAGKTHLAQAQVAQQGGFYLSLSDGALQPDVLEGLEAFSPLYLDNIDQIAGDIAWEEALFALWNACLDQQVSLICFAARPVDGSSWVIPDLRSRMAQLPQFSLKPLAESDLRAALERRAKLIDLRLPGEVIEYLLRHHARSISQLASLLTQLERASLQLKRPLTIPLIRQILGARD